MRNNIVHILFCLFFTALTVQAGGSPLRTLVVVNAGSDRSLEAGRYYAELRGIPDRNIVHLVFTNLYSMDLGTYSNEVKNPLQSYMSLTGISNQIDTIVFSMDVPYRVVSGNPANERDAGITATTYYGHYSSSNSCDLAAGSDHDYFGSERSFDRFDGLNSNRYYLSAMITASNLAIARQLVRRSAKADYSRPSSRVYLLRTSDAARRIQWKEFGDTLFLKRFLNVPQEFFWLDADSVSGRTNVFGVTAGNEEHAWIGNNINLPGAYADHLTSFGGYLFEPTSQMSILDWIYHGFSGSYGTVVEPCAYTNKFTSPRLHYWYARGFSLGESHWMSVQNPYQGIFVGDPLCAPYARPPSVGWSGLTNGTVLSGSVVVSATGSAVDASLPIDQVRWYLDGIVGGVVTNIHPASGNEITVTVNGNDRTYTVAGSDTIYSIAENIAIELNMAPPLGITAEVHGDRVVIKQNALGVDADGWTCTASVAPGTASVITVQVDVPETNFLETALSAREGLSLSGSSKSGDVVRVVVTRLDGVVVTNEVTITTDGASTYDILVELALTISADTNLQSAAGCRAKNVADNGDGMAEAWLFARTNTWEGHNLFVDYEVDKVAGSSLTGPDFSDNFNDNKSVLGARATLFISAGMTQINAAVTLNTSNWPDGPHELMLAARDGTGVGTEGRSAVRVIVDNHDVECSVDAPADGMYRLKSGILTVDVSTAVSVGTVTQLVLFAEGKPVSTGVTGSASVELSLDAYGAGSLNLQGRAWADSGRSAVSDIARIQLYTDIDEDLVSDQWEYDNFGSTTNYTGGSDADNDGYSNYKEFISDTEPTNELSYLRINVLDNDLNISFDTSASRRYRVRLNDELINGNWYAVGDSFAGTGGTILWTNAPAATNAARFHAVEPLLP